MKLFKIFSAIILTVALLGNVTVFAKKTPQELATEELVSLSILKGNEDAELLLDKTVTRAEMAVIVCRLLALEDTAIKNVPTKPLFSDVSETHWAAGYIDIVKAYKIVNGYPDGTFRPEQEVSYAQVIKMLVATCGYLPKAEQMGGYPMGVIAVAAQNGITKGLSFGQEQPATRGDVALLVQNTLDVPLLVQTGFGAYEEYQVNPDNTLRNLRITAQP